MSGPQVREPLQDSDSEAAVERQPKVQDDTPFKTEVMCSRLDIHCPEGPHTNLEGRHEPPGLPDLEGGRRSRWGSGIFCWTQWCGSSAASLAEDPEELGALSGASRHSQSIKQIPVLSRGGQSDGSRRPGGPARDTAYPDREDKPSSVWRSVLKSPNIEDFASVNWKGVCGFRIRRGGPSGATFEELAGAHRLMCHHFTRDGQHCVSRGLSVEHANRCAGALRGPLLDASPVCPMLGARQPPSGGMVELGRCGRPEKVMCLPETCPFLAGGFQCPYEATSDPLRLELL